MGALIAVSDPVKNAAFVVWVAIVTGAKLLYDLYAVFSGWVDLRGRAFYVGYEIALPILLIVLYPRKRRA
ncbi:MAG: hypothetical protein ACE5LG_01725 [Anaerolineae bacterium]